MSTKIDAEAIYTRAVRAYARRCNRDGRVYQEPSRTASAIKGGSVVLRNGRGELARFTYAAASDRLAFAGWG